MQVVCKPLWAKVSFDFEKNTNTLSKFVGYIDLTNFHQVLPKHSRNNEKWKCVRKFWFFTYLSLGVQTQHALHVFSYSNFRCQYLNNQSEYWKAWHSFVNWCLLNKIVQPFCLCCSMQYPMNLIEEPLALSCLTGSWHFLKRKGSYITFFNRNLQLLSFLLICSVLGFLVKLVHVQIFSRRTAAKVGSNFVIDL